MKTVNVAVGVVQRNDEIFVCLRPDDVHQGGKWEFPGGKVEANESVVDALARELDEEIGIQVTHSAPLVEINHDYGDKHVTLHVYRVTGFTGEPTGKENQPSKWVSVNALRPEDFPKANVAIIKALQR